ncbi:MAG: NUDIX domain-containing protein [Kiritimatiellae bacterium]|nr:NUDIX domain-containing protein [Kiritimatiellia bacterium]
MKRFYPRARAGTLSWFSAFCLTVVAALTPAVSLGDTGYSAGVVIYTETPQGVAVLLADHVPPSKRGWASFGGSHEPGESVTETAARETEEETHGYFKRADILLAIKTQQPVFDGSFALFFVRVKHSPTEDIVKAAIPADNEAYMERGPYAWIPCTEIERLLTLQDSVLPLRVDSQYLPADAHTDWLWPVWIHNLRVAITKNALPWKTNGTNNVNPPHR